MRKIITILLSAALVLALSFQAFAGTITVNGNGEVLVTADTAIISLGVTARDKDVKAAQETVNNAIANVRKALSDAGIPDEDVNTGYISIYAIYDYYDYNSSNETISAYSASNSLAIRTTDMEKIGELIDLAFDAGANTLDGINFSASDTDAAKARALENAVKDAKAKADILAAASGQEIAGIESITESGTYSYDRGLMNNFSIAAEAKMDDSAGTFVQAAKLTVSAGVLITYNTVE